MFNPKLIALIAFFLGLSLFGACSSDNDMVSHSEQEEVQAESSKDEELTYDIGEVGDIDPQLYVERDGRCLPLSWSLEIMEDLRDVYSVDESSVTYEHDAYLEISDTASTRSFLLGEIDVLETGVEESPIPIDRGKGDSLITTTGNAVAYTVRESGYCPGYTRPLGKYDEIAGVDISSLDSDDVNNAVDTALRELGGSLSRNYIYLNDKGHHVGSIPVRESTPLITASHPVEITAGYYEGTKWESGRFPMRTYYVIDERIELDIEKTKEGYFVANISSLEPGRYYLGSAIVDII